MSPRDRQQSLLKQIVRRQTSPQQQVRRAKLILTMAEGKNNQQTAQHLDVHRETVQQWRSRWLAAVPCLTAAELGDVSDKELQAMLLGSIGGRTPLGIPCEIQC